MDMIEVYVESDTFIIDNALEWCNENSLSILKYEQKHSENTFGRAIIYGFVFFFLNEEDATAFKLRWG